jgi:hypothetical protein
MLLASAGSLLACGRISYDSLDAGPGAEPPIDAALPDAEIPGLCTEFVGTDFKTEGDGSAGNPYLLCNKEQLQSWALGMAGDDVLVLGTSIDLSGVTWTPTGSFTGTFDGAGHAITGVTRIDAGSGGFFESLGSGAVVRDLRLLELNISGTVTVGGLAASSTGATIESVQVEGTISGTGDNIGGLVGSATNTTMRDLQAAVTVTGEGNIGGIVGNMSSGTMERSSASGTITGSQAEGCTMVGGLVGYAINATLSESFATATVSSAGAANGGLIGWAQTGTVSDCYATGSVAGGRSIDDTCSTVFDLASLGGLIGVDYNGVVQRSYATGATNTPYIIAAGLLGHGWTTSDMQHNFATGLVTAAGDQGGLYGRANGGTDTGSYWSIAGTGVSSMCSGGASAACDNSRGIAAPGAATYFFDASNPPLDQWDFTNVWLEHPDRLPTLRWQQP